MAADNKVLGSLHERATQIYLEITGIREVPMMSKGEVLLDDEGNPRMMRLYPTAAEMAAVNAFLKQNNITSNPDEDPGLEALQKQLAARRRREAPLLPDFGAEEMH